MHPCISVLTHISSDVTQPSLYLTAKNGKKYLVGRIGEGFQRAIGEQKVRTSKLSGVFLTGEGKWDSVSGIPGMLLSFADRELGIDRIHTAAGLPYERALEMIKSWNNFTFHQPLNVVPDHAKFEDDNVEIMPFNVGGTSSSYRIQLQPARGKFMVAKAKALGVPPGKLFGQLSEGQAVTLPDSNRVVEPHEVLGPAPLPSRVLVLDLPTTKHVQNALEHEYLELMLDPRAANSSGEYDLRAVYYLLGRDVDLYSPHLQRLVAALSQPKTEHLISHPLASPDFNTLHTLAEFQSVFRSEFPDHFSLLYSQPAKQSLPAELTSSIPGADNRVNMRQLVQGHCLSLAPHTIEEDGGKKKKKAKVDQEYVPPPVPERQSVVDAQPFIPCHLLTEPEVVTLGTGASVPSKYRNVSGTLVRSHFGSIIFDCGEGTANTLSRLYGPKGKSALVSELRVLYISHMHADHHLGGQQILRAWLEQAPSTQNKLVLAAPCQYLRFINHWAQIDNFTDALQNHVYQLDLDTVCIGKRFSPDATAPVSQTDLAEAAAACGGISVVTCTAIHCTYSYNGTITTPPNSEGKRYKFSYSGDTRPNRFFAQNVGYGSDLLVHEATHENELAEEAVKKRHSTINEALSVAKLMHAKNTILTHISQRYPRLPTISNQDLEKSGQFACFGFDGMRTKLSEIKNIQQMVPKMSELFGSLEEQREEDETE